MLALTYLESVKKYISGDGLPPQGVEVIKLIQQSAERGSAWGQFIFGWLHYKGRGVQVDDKVAFKWFKLAADQKYSLARIAIGLMYEKGRGFQQDENMAVQWYRLAVEQEGTEAQYYFPQIMPRCPK